MEGENSQESNSNNKKKIHNGRGNLSRTTSDRISKLPDSLLIQVLSFLETKDAFKTCILSKRWKNVWTHVEGLSFDYVLKDDESKGPENLRKFISFVDHTLLHCTTPDLKYFSLFSGFLFFYDVSDFVHDAIHKWLRCLFEKNVERLVLVMTLGNYCAPEWFYHNPSLVRLHVFDWEIKILGSTVNWPSLKILQLTFVRIDDEQMEKVLSGCPVLETLSFNRIVSVAHLNIMSQSVKMLELYQESESDDLLDLNAPWLQELRIVGTFFSVIPRMIDVSSLITAMLLLDPFVLCSESSDDDEDLLLDMAYELLESMHRVKELTLSIFFIQALSIKKRLGRPSPLFMCKHLTIINFSSLEYDLLGLACLIQSSPNLENLVIKMNDFTVCNFPKLFVELGDMDISLIPPSKNSLHPKNVEIHSKDLCFVQMLQKYSQSSNETCPEIILAEYLFRNAPFKGKLVISTRLGNCKKCTKNCASRYLSLLSSKFFSLWVKRDDDSEWRVTKKCSALEISRV